MTRSTFLTPVIASLCLLLVSCDDNVPPSPTPIPTGTSAPVVSRISATVPPTMTAVGDTVKLSLTAFYTDGTSKDVAALAAWTVDMPSVLRVTNGEATALSLGATYVYARFDRFNASTIVEVTPPGTFTMLGGTREPGMSGLSGVTVTHPSSGVTTVTNASGLFTLGGLLDRTLHLEKPGYEDATYSVAVEEFPWLAMQRLIRIQPGNTASVRIAPRDMDYEPLHATVPGERCSPCKLIRVLNAPGNRLRVTLKWAPVNIGLKLWNDDGTFAGTSPGLLERDIENDATDLWLYVGQSAATAARAYVDVQVTVTKLN